MESNLLTLIYLIGSVTFIIGLKMLSNPAKARRGNLIAAGGMALAIVGTIFLYTNEDGKKLGNYGWIFGGLVIGTIIGTLAAKKVKMTAMPEMVSMFNGMGGACAALISIVEFSHLQKYFTTRKGGNYAQLLRENNWFTGAVDYYFGGTYYRFRFLCRQHDCLGKIKWKDKRLFI